jgi:hypothetical protein
MRQTNSRSLDADSAAVTTSVPRGASTGPTTNRSSPEPVCDVDPYPRYAPGVYEVRCVRARVYRDPQFKCWKCLVEFQFLNDEAKVVGFFNMGTGEKPKAGRRSRYYAAWVMANGEMPKKRQVVSCRVFEGKIFKVRVEDIATRHDGGEHPEAAIYSTVKEILKRMWP